MDNQEKSRGWFKAYYKGIKEVSQHPFLRLPHGPSLLSRKLRSNHMGGEDEEATHGLLQEDELSRRALARAVRRIRIR